MIAYQHKRSMLLPTCLAVMRIDTEFAIIGQFCQLRSTGDGTHRGRQSSNHGMPRLITSRSLATVASRMHLNRVLLLA